MNISVHINSHVDRQQQDSTTKWTTMLSQPIKVGLNDNIQVNVDRIDFPNTCYTFPWHSYKFWFIRNAGTTNDLTSIDIDRTKNWNNGSDVAGHLTSQMSNAGYSAITFSYDTNTAKLSISNNLANPIRIVSSYRYIQDTALYAQIDHECTDRLGFTNDYRNLTIANGEIYTAPTVLRLLRTSCYYLCADIASAEIRQSQVASQNEQPNIMARISASNFGSVSQLDFANTMYYKCVAPGGIKVLNFSVLDDEYYDLDDLNGSPIVFSLKFLIT